MTRVPFLDLPAQSRRLQPEIDSALRRVLERGQFVLGPEAEALEAELAKYCGSTAAVGVASGTDALELALRACGIGPGDEVITTAFSFIATAEAIVAAGATPIFADIDPVTYAIDPRQVEARLSPKTKALLPVHLYGHPCDMEALLRIAKSAKLAVIEDCAQAIGAAVGTTRAGSFGAAGCFSFYPTKNLGAYGDAGLVTTSDAELAKRVRLLRHHGDTARYQHAIIGRNSRLDELQAAILRVKFAHLEAWTEERRTLAARYTDAFRRAAIPGVVLPTEKPGTRHVWHLYVIRHPRRDAVQRALADQGIVTSIHYPSILPKQPALAASPDHGRAFPAAEQAAAEVLALPLYPGLPVDSIEAVVSAIARAG